MTPLVVGCLCSHNVVASQALRPSAPSWPPGLVLADIALPDLIRQVVFQTQVSRAKAHQALYRKMTSPAVRQTPQPLQCPVNDLQLRSSFFGKLPAEIRQQIYDECWLASGPQQHVLLRQGRHSPLGGGLTHFPCCKTPGDESEMLSEHDGIVENQRQSRSRSSAFLVDETWLSRFSSPWLDHWRCEEALREEDLVRDFERSSGVTPRQRTLFLPMLLCCRRM